MATVSVKGLVTRTLRSLLTYLLTSGWYP